MPIYKADNYNLKYLQMKV